MRSLPVDQKNVITEIFGQSEAKILIVYGINLSDKRRTIIKRYIEGMLKVRGKTRKENPARANGQRKNSAKGTQRTETLVH